MAKIRFYTDEHVSKALVQALRRRGVDVHSTPEANMRGATDEAQLQLAFREGRVLVTHDDDFLRLAMRSTHAGIVYASQDTPIRKAIAGLLLIHQVLDAEDMREHVEFL